MKLFAEACAKLGYHPYDTAAGILSQPYRPPEPFDTRIASGRPAFTAGTVIFTAVTSTPNRRSLYTVIPVALETGNFDLKTQSKVFRINSDSAGQVTGVNYFDADGKVHEQRARVVILSAFVFEHVRLLLLSKTTAGRFHQRTGEQQRLCRPQHHGAWRRARHGRVRRLHHQRLHRSGLGGDAHRRFQRQ